jgi:hypothetical protein
MCSFIGRGSPWRLAAGLALGFWSSVAAADGRDAPAGRRPEPASVGGTVRSGGTGLASFKVELYRTRSGCRPHADRFRPDGCDSRAELLGRAVTTSSGRFEIGFDPPADPDSVLYLVARRGPVALATALVGSPEPGVSAAADGTAAHARPSEVVINERTTVAVGFALAQFIDGRNVSGNRVGVRNAAAMAGNLVDMRTGEIAPVLASPPNGERTSTLRAFNALANLVESCVAERDACPALFDAASGRGDRRPSQTLQAVVAIARNPWRHVARLYELSKTGPRTYTPALAKAPDAWTIALRFAGDGTLNGPGDFAIDARGNAWLTNNYTPGGPLANVCGGKTLFKFVPTGQLFPGAPYAGGGVEGAGFGIALDPRGRIWVGNFGFQSPACAAGPDAASHDSVSLFRADGTPLSPPRGFTAGRISWPQGTVSDRQGNIWIANCGNDSLTVYPQGDPRRARNIGGRQLGVEKPFDIAVDGRGRVWVTGNDNSVVGIVGDGPVRRIQGKALDRPLGIASDSRGNMWVANSAVTDIPCPDGGPVLGGEGGGSVALIRADGTVAPGAPFRGGGLTVPWGVAVDGDDNVWVANFGNGRGAGGSDLVRLSQFCGARPENCPPGLRTGDPISPPTGYTSDGLARTTAATIDPSGNVWVTNNWKIVPPPNDPGGNSIMIFLGLAGPVRTPLIGPPVAAR